MIDNKLDSLQFCRAIAALLVVFYHETQFFDINLHSTFVNNYFYGGFGGVDFFFVLSGFIITYTSSNYIGKKNKLVEFARKRFVRIYPIYWVYLVFMIIGFLVVPNYFKNSNYFNIHTIWKTFFLLFRHNEIITTSWSLSYEVYFYFLFGLAIWMPNLIKYSWIILILSIINFSFQLINGNYLFVKDSYLDKIFNPLIIEFALGIFAFLFWKKIPHKISRTLLIFGIAIFLFDLVNYKYIMPSWGLTPRILTFGIPSFLIVISLVNIENQKKIYIPWFLLLIGDASYTLYLIHRQLLSAMNQISISKGRYILINPQLNSFIYIILIVILSVLLYKFVELKLVKLTNKLLRKI